MITSWEIYWITRLDILSGMLLGSAMVTGFSCFLAWLIPELHDELDKGKMRTWRIFSTVLFIPIFLLAGLCPNAKQYAAIVFIPRVLNNEELKGEAKEVYGLAKAWLVDVTTEKRE